MRPEILHHAQVVVPVGHRGIEHQSQAGVCPRTPIEYADQFGNLFFAYQRH